jgi:hypothetical protein
MEPERTMVDPGEMRVELDGELSLGSGQTHTHALLLTNLSDRDISVHTNGHLTVSVIDPGTGTVVGGYSGAELQPLVIFTAAPEQTVRIPLFVATDSFDSDFGYAIPPGTWQLSAPMDLEDGRRVATAPLEFTITE